MGLSDFLTKTAEKIRKNEVKNDPVLIGPVRRRFLEGSKLL